MGRAFVITSRRNGSRQHRFHSRVQPPGGGTLSAALSGRNPSVQLAVSVLPSVQLPYSYLPVTLIRSGIVPLQVGERRLPSDAACWVGTRGGSIFQVAVAVAVVLTSKAVMKTSKCIINDIKIRSLFNAAP